MIVKACALVIVGTISALLLKEFGWRATPVFCSICAVSVISLATPYIFSGVSLLGVFDGYGFGDISGAALKIVGIGYLSGITADTCRDLGFAELSGPVTFVGRLEMLAIAYPYFKELVLAGVELIK